MVSWKEKCLGLQVDISFLLPSELEQFLNKRLLQTINLGFETPRLKGGRAHSLWAGVLAAATTPAVTSLLLPQGHLRVQCH